MRVRILLVALSFVTAAAAAGDELDAALGRALFNRNWVPAPSSTDAANGLGPLFNARSCVGCHPVGGAARVRPSGAGGVTIKGAVVRLGDAAGSADRYYGRQLQSGAVPGLEPEAVVRFLPRLGIQLKGPRLAQGIKTGVRVAPTLLGRGAFEEIPDDEILKRAGEGGPGGGFTGRARRLGADGMSGPVGRFGWKAAQATLGDQIANAFALDLGLSSPSDPRPYGDCTALQTTCLSAPNGVSAKLGGFEISGDMADLVRSYVQSLAPPRPIPAREELELFEKTGCALCHVPSLKGRDGAIVVTFSDLLLHDMGAELDDGVGEPGVKSSEWRTAPLIDLSNRGSTRRYLHDGRAAGLDAAIRQHGGEGARAAQNFAKLDGADKRRLIAFLERL
jgi:CxxC motif-containing protein (DUF1111 family)